MVSRPVCERHGDMLNYGEFAKNGMVYVTYRCITYKDRWNYTRPELDIQEVKCKEVTLEAWSIERG